MESDQGVVEAIVKQNAEASSSSENKVSAAAAQPAPTRETKILTADENTGRTEVSASTIGRMMGLATKSEMHLLESKIDLLSTKLTNMTMRFEKIQTSLQSLATGSDLERVDVQIGSLKTVLADLIAQINTFTGTSKKEAGVARPTANAKIVSSEPNKAPSEVAATKDETGASAK